ncbi:TIM-barrel domain-containing protein [Vibrio sp. F74]|uniref:glycoside hydrolase family 31 protein n=1 Tax=Vibrio sp. F74 TaxID=700020 RepID=UPI0035F57B6D
MKTVKQWRFLQQENCLSQDRNRIDIECDGRHQLHIFVLEQDIIRVMFKNKGELRLDKTWSIAPGQKDVPWEGRDKYSTEGFSCPSYLTQQDDGVFRIETEALRLSIHQPLWMEWEYKKEDQWLPLATDRKTGAYQLGVSENGVAHFMNRNLSDQYYGLGEKSGDLNRSGRRFEMRNLDAMGYDASATDPLYKHIPFYITRVTNQEEAVSFGLYYDNLASCWFDLGNELDNYHVKYRSYRAEDGDLDFYFMLGKTVANVSKKFVRLTGGTAFGPRWSLGYSGSTMQYTDAPNAQELLEGFVDKCETHAIPCDSFQLSSGYTSIGNTRYVFNWNNDKVPNPNAMADVFHNAGIKLAANIKPCLLHDHPRFAEAQEKGLFILDSEHDEPEKSVFWDADGSHLDFTNPDTIKWWQDNVKEQLLEKGIDSTWNDNNEYEIWDKGARCFGFGQTIPVSLIRPLQPLLMMRASYEAQVDYAPDVRPYLISRSGCPGMNRYVQTWSGDNRTNWTSLKYNIRMGLGMSLSGLYNLGHDVGGFSGERPDPELFARWVQNGVMHPRFTIHSWNDDGSVNEPWMYPEVTPIIRDAMALRYRIMPYLYNLLWQAHSEDEPIMRPTFLDHENDPHTFEECDDFLLGKDLLVASVVEQGQREREIYLPNNGKGWYDFYSGQWFSGGQSIVVPAPLETLPLMVKAGSVLPTSERVAHSAHSKDTKRNLEVFPLKGCGEITLTIFDDDGESHNYKDNGFLTLTINMVCSQTTVALNIQSTGEFEPAYKAFVIKLAQCENRELLINGKTYKNGDSLSLAETK